MSANTGRTRVDVRCAATTAGWQCALTVGGDDGRGMASQLTMTIATTDALALAGLSSQEGVERLAFETVHFLLEREPRESILRTFDITVVSRYFPEFEAEIRSRLAP